jgi:hypothetical protein
LIFFGVDIVGNGNKIVTITKAFAEHLEKGCLSRPYGAAHPNA